jgi:hypothetical protein
VKTAARAVVGFAANGLLKFNGGKPAGNAGAVG